MSKLPSGLTDLYQISANLPADLSPTDVAKLAGHLKMDLGIVLERAASMGVGELRNLHPKSATMFLALLRVGAATVAAATKETDGPDSLRSIVTDEFDQRPEARRSPNRDPAPRTYRRRH